MRCLPAVSQVLRLLLPSAHAAARLATGLAVRRRSRRFRTAVLLGTSSVAAAVLYAPCAASSWGGGAGRGWGASSSVGWGAAVGVAAVGFSALYSCGVEEQQRLHATGPTQCAHSLSRDQFLITAALVFAAEFVERIFPHAFGGAGPAPPQLISQDGNGGFVVAVHSLLLWSMAAAGAMGATHVCALYPMRARVHRLVVQARPCASIVVAFLLWGYSGFACDTVQGRYVWGGGGVSKGEVGAALPWQEWMEGHSRSDVMVHLLATAIAIGSAMMHASLPPATEAQVMASHFGTPKATDVAPHDAFNTPRRPMDRAGERLAAAEAGSHGDVGGGRH